MEIGQIEEKLKHLLKNAEEIITDQGKRKVFLDAINKKTKIIDQISNKAKDLPLLIDITKDYINGKYKVIPVKSILAIVATLIYVINPFDLVPDTIPIIGITDDVTAILLCTKAISSDLEDYKKWKQENK